MKKTSKKSLSFILVLVMILSLFSGLMITASAAPWDGAETTAISPAGDTYSVNTAAELAWIAAQVNSGNDFAGKEVVLTADIDLGSMEWTPIGVADITVTGADGANTYFNAGSAANRAFAGVFDGGDHTISGLLVTGGKNAVALFSYVTGTIKNLTVSGAVSGANYVAGVAALSSGTIENITNLATVAATGNCVAGILAEGLDGAFVSECTNLAEISNTSTERSTGRVAGIVGRIESGSTATITKCANTANITGYQYVAGIIGGSFGNVSISYCYNTGNITSNSFGKTYLGGIAGKLESGTIDSSYNTGNLHNAHWAPGHIRAVGGIAGCEENHPGTLAITNCYTTGNISFNTSNMIPGQNFIYMTGNISGGNQSSAANTMRYENCFYLEGAMTIADLQDPGYTFWSDVYKSNPLAYDTGYITSCTSSELITAVLANCSAFEDDASAVNGGYPILFWQVGQTTPAPSYHSISSSSVNGNVTISTSTSAEAGSAVTVTLSDLEASKQMKSVAVTDSAGNILAVSENLGTYTFTMPPRAVSIVVTLENIVSGGASSFAVNMPTGLDAIWSVSYDSTHKQSDGTVSEGATVFVTVAKAEDAEMTSFDGIVIKDEAAQNISASVISEASGVSGTYAFTMPSAAVSVSLDISYAAFNVYTQNSPTGTPSLAASYDRQEMIDLAEGSAVYYSGYSSETDPLIGKGEQAVYLSSILSDVGISFSAGDVLKVTASDGMSLLYTYDSLIGTERYYYPEIMTDSTANKSASEPMFVIKGNVALLSENVSVDSKIGDTLNAYRFIFGQSEADFSGNVKSVDKLPKAVCSITIISADDSGGSSGGGGGAQNPTAGMNLTSTTWDGSSIDVSWYYANQTRTSYTISTAAELAGVAALVNGLVNADCKVWDGTRVYTATQWASSHAYDDVGTIGGNNQATAEYFYGITEFFGVTLTLASDLNMSAGNWMPIGGSYLMTKNVSATKISSNFVGIFDGGGHTVTIECDRHAAVYGDGANVGFIGRLGTHDGETFTGSYSPTVRNLIIRGSVHANRSVGGIVGKTGNQMSSNGYKALIENCANFATVSNTDAKGCGGIVGAAWNGAVVRNCYNAGNVSSTYNGPTGGIAGSSEAIISNCYNIGTITAPANYAVAIATNNGGGQNVTNCYWLEGSAPVGFFGSLSGTVTEKTSAEMKTEAFLTALNADGVWAMDTKNANKGYPIFEYQVSGNTPNPGGSVTAPETEAEDAESGTTEGAAFADILPTDWFYDAVAFVSENGLMTGTSSDAFSPNLEMSRAMLVTVLYRMEGEPTVSAASAFEDVGSGNWYTNAVIWATERGIVNGFSDTVFAPNENITREQMAAILYRYAEYKEYDISGSADLSVYKDEAAISDWSYVAVQWANVKMLITGMTADTLSPQSSATRAQVATILMRFVNTFGELEMEAVET